MTLAEREAQRRSFAYGNTKRANDAVTRELIDEATDCNPAPDDDPPLHPGRVVAAVVVCMTVMIACAAGAVHTAWCALGIPLAPLVAAGTLLRRRHRP